MRLASSSAAVGMFCFFFFKNQWAFGFFADFSRRHRLDF